MPGEENREPKPPWHPGHPITPDPQDFDREITSESDHKRAVELGMAQARKLNLLYAAWKAEQN
jgi:hypothetical protein